MTGAPRPEIAGRSKTGRPACPGLLMSRIPPVELEEDQDDAAVASAGALWLVVGLLRV